MEYTETDEQKDLRDFPPRSSYFGLHFILFSLPPPLVFFPTFHLNFFDSSTITLNALPSALARLLSLFLGKPKGEKGGGRQRGKRWKMMAFRM